MLDSGLVPSQGKEGVRRDIIRIPRSPLTFGQVITDVVSIVSFIANQLQKYRVLDRSKRTLFAASLRLCATLVTCMPGNRSCQ